MLTKTTTTVTKTAYKNFAIKEFVLTGNSSSMSDRIASFHAKPATNPNAAIKYPATRSRSSSVNFVSFLKNPMLL